MQAHGLRDFLLPMLSFAPGRRASAAQALAHPWLRGELPQPPPAEGPRGGGQGHGGGHRRDDRSKSAVRSRSPRRSRSPSR
jgi:serine/threonine protein kinase